MRTRIQLLAVTSAALTAAILFSACGKETVLSPVSGTTGNLQGFGGTPSSSGGGPSGGYSNGTSSSSDPFNATKRYTFSLTGSNGSSGTYTLPPVQTDNLLNIRMIVGPAQQVNVPGTTFTANYSCAGYRVTIGGQSIQTAALNTGAGSPYSPCTSSGDAQIFRLSHLLTPGHGPISVVVSHPRYSFKYESCKAAPWLYTAMGIYNCQIYHPMTGAYDTHVLTGTIELELNGP